MNEPRAVVLDGVPGEPSLRWVMFGDGHRTVMSLTELDQLAGLALRELPPPAVAVMFLEWLESTGITVSAAEWAAYYTTTRPDSP